MTDLDSARLVAGVLAQAYSTLGRAADLFARIDEDFEQITDASEGMQSRMHDAVVDLFSRGRLLNLVVAALDDPAQAMNVALHNALRPIIQQTRWQLLDVTGHVMRLGQFVNRSNLKDAVSKLLLSRRVLQIIGTTGARGRSWSCQLIERETALRGGVCISVDLRNEPLRFREAPKWLAEKLLAGLFPDPAQPPSIEGVAENRLVEPLITAWFPLSALTVIVLDHVGDANVSMPVREYVTALALAIVAGKLAGLRLVLIDGPPGLDLTNYALYTAEDIVGQITLDHLKAYFASAAGALFPGAAPEGLATIVEAAVAPLAPALPAGASENLAVSVRDALEEMAMR